MGRRLTDEERAERKRQEEERKKLFWHPNIYEWRAYCEVHPECDPKSTMLMKDGSFTAIWMKDDPMKDVEEGRRIQKERREQQEREQREELARTQEEAIQDAVKREQYRSRLIKDAKRQEEKGKEYALHTAQRKKAITTDDPFQASVLNAVDKERRGKNANYIVHAKRLSELPKIALSDPEEIRDRVNFYYQLCVTDGIRPNLPGFALAFGLTRTGLMNALSDRRMTRDCADELGRGIAMLDDIISGMALDGLVNPVAVIYFMNNWLGYKNASEVTTRTETVETAVDQKALEQKYNTVIDMD